MPKSVTTCCFIGHSKDMVRETDPPHRDPLPARDDGWQTGPVPLAHGTLGGPGRNTDARSEDSRYLFEDIVRPVCRLPRFQFECMRLDHIGRPQVNLPLMLDQILGADIAIFDLTDAEPNIIYELGLRHMMCRPVVHFIRKGFSPCFDLAHTRPIVFDPDDGTRHETTKNELADLFYSHIHDPDGHRLRPINSIYRGDVVIGGVELRSGMASHLDQFIRERKLRGRPRPRNGSGSRPFY